MNKINLKIVMLALMMFGQAVLAEAKITISEVIWDNTEFPGATKVMLSPDDSLIFAYSNNLIIYSLSDGRAIDTMEYYRTGDFTDDGEHFVAIREVPDDSLFYVDILNTKTFGREKRFTFSLELFQKNATWIVKFNAAGNKVAISRFNRIMLLDIESEDTTLFPGYNYRVEVGEFGNNDKYLYYDTNSFYQTGKYAGIYGKLIRRDLETGEEIEIDNNCPTDYPPSLYPFTHFTRSSDRRYIAYEGGTAICRDIIDSTRIAMNFWLLSFSKDNEYFLIGDVIISGYRYIYFVSPKTGEILGSVNTKYNDNFGFLTSDNQYLLVGGVTGQWGMALYKMDYGSSVENQEGTSSQLIADELLYPNPTDNTITIKIIIQKPMELTYSLYSMKGELIKVLSRTIENQGEINRTFKLDNLSNGVYLLQVQGEKYNKTYKIIKNK
jgi:hypothetical protein